MKKIIIIIAAVVAVAAAALYFFVLRPKPEPVPITYSPGDYFVTNVNDSNRLLKTTVVLVLDNSKLYKKLPTKLEQHNAELRDIIIFILRGLSEEEIRTIGVEDGIRTQIRTVLNERMNTEGITDVLFNDFVMQ